MGRATPDVQKAREAKKVLQAKPGAKAAAGAGSPAAKAPATTAPAPAAKAPEPATTVNAAPQTTSAVGPPGGASGGGGTLQQPAQPASGGPPGPSGVTADPDRTNKPEDTSVEALIHTLGHGRDPDARKRAAEALGRLTATKAREALEKAVRDPDHGVAAAARAALKQIG